MDGVFRSNGVFLQSWILLHSVISDVGIFAEQFCCRLSVVLTALGSCWRYHKRHQFCDFLVCPEFPFDAVFSTGGVGLPSLPEQTPCELSEVFASFADHFLSAMSP